MKGRTFYQGRLYSVSMLASTEQCKKSALLSMLKEKYGEPKLTETVNGHEITPAVLEGGPLSKSFSIFIRYSRIANVE
jgi:hypothetical protein